MLSCTNLLGKKSANESETAKKNAAYITLSVAGLGRNVNPVINAEALTNFVLKGTKAGATEQTLGHWNAVNELQTAKCAVLWKNYDGRIEELKKRAEEQLGYDDPNEFN